jgi:hypothetical protein
MTENMVPNNVSFGSWMAFLAVVVVLFSWGIVTSSSQK